MPNPEPSAPGTQLAAGEPVSAIPLPRQILARQQVAGSKTLERLREAAAPEGSEQATGGGCRVGTGSGAAPGEAAAVDLERLGLPLGDDRLELGQPRRAAVLGGEGCGGEQVDEAVLERAGLGIRRSEGMVQARRQLEGKVETPAGGDEDRSPPIVRKVTGRRPPAAQLRRGGAGAGPLRTGAGLGDRLEPSDQLGLLTGRRNLEKEGERLR